MIQQFGRYIIKSKLGQGGMATVYQAHDPRFKRDVAIKVLPQVMLDNAVLQARFEREAQVIASLEYNGIVPVYDYGDQDGQPYLVMRFMPGGSLADRIAQRPLQLDEIARTFSRLAPALDLVHSKGIIHRDLKPANILFDQHDQAWISDFGIARISEGSQSLTGEALIGTPAYMSPEQAQGIRELDGRSDIYAMGAILFEMLTGKQPYEATTPMGVILKHIIDPVPLLRSVNADLPENLEVILSRSMDKDRTLRYPTMAAMASDLTAVLANRFNSADRAAESSKPIRQASIISSEAAKPTVKPPTGESDAKPDVQPVSQSGTKSDVKPVSQPRLKPAVSRKKQKISPYLIIGGLFVAGFICLGAIAGGWALYSTYFAAGETAVIEKIISTQESANIITDEPDIVLNDETESGASPYALFDDFSDPGSGWETYTGDEGRLDYHSGSFEILVDTTNWLMISRPGYSAEDTIIETEAYKSSGPDENIFGAVCRYQDEYNFYFQVISSDGYFGIGKVVDSETFLINADTLTYSSYINQGRTSNLLQAECVGSNLTLQVNGTQLVQVEDYEFSFGEVGLLAGSYDQYGVNILFDNFKLVDLDQP